MKQRVLIVGGGIGGLATAVGLKKMGLEPTIVERSPSFGAAGAGLILGTNALWALGELGLDGQAREVARVVDWAEVTDSRGQVLSRADMGRLAKEFGPTLSIHRHRLHEVLLSGCDGLELVSGTTVDELNQQGDRVEVTLSNGEERSFDWVIGADGIYSTTRQQVGIDGSPRYAGYLCWRFVVELPDGIDRMQEMWGRGRRFGLVPLADGLLYCFACVDHRQGDPDPAEQRLKRLNDEFGDFGGKVPIVLAQLGETTEIISNEIDDMVKVDWRSGRVLLIGDAAHATTPNMGQGAAMALEDAAVLAEMLGAQGDWSTTLDAFVARREPRVRKIVNQSRSIGRVGQSSGVVTSRIRDLVLRSVPASMAHSMAVKAASVEI